MAFELMGEKDSIKGEKIYTIKVFFDADTNTQRNEYVVNGEVLYNIEFEQHDLQDPDKDLDLDSVVSGFDDWYDEFGPNWRPSPFYIS